MAGVVDNVATTRHDITRCDFGVTTPMEYREGASKACIVCRGVKPLLDFIRDSSRPDGHREKCRVCYAIDRKKWRINQKLNAKPREMPVFDENTTFQRCSRCKETKPLSAYHKNRWRRLGRSPDCKECHNRQSRERDARIRAVRESEKPAVPEGHKRCPRCEQILPLDSFYTHPTSPTGRNCHCKRCIKEVGKQRYREDAEYREKLRQKRREGYRKERAQGRNTRREWALRHPERERAIQKRVQARRRANPILRVESRILRILRRSLSPQSTVHGKSLDWPTVLGYTSEDLRRHIETHFASGMTWEKFFNGEIEIDHTIPRCAFYYETESDQDFKECWSLSNLKPLWRCDNRAKSWRMPDGSDGRILGERKRRLLAEESSVAGYELVAFDDAFP